MKTASEDKPAMITVHMRSQDHQDSSGWMVRLKAFDPELRATSKAESFGRISHIIKKDGASVILQQGVSSENKTQFTALTAEQRAILKALTEVGIVSKIIG